MPTTSGANQMRLIVFLSKNGLIVAIGKKDELAKLATSVEEYDRCLILPGFCDAHIHLSWLGENLTGCDLRGCTDSKDFLSRLSSWSIKLAPGEVLLGFGWDERGWADPQKVTAELIDKAVPDHPALLVKIDGHSYAVNTLMLERAKISKDTSDVDGGRIDRDDKGNPSGLLLDNAAGAAIATLEKTDKLKECKAAFEHLLSNGVTSIRTFGTLDNFIELGRLAQENGSLPVRVCACVPCDNIEFAKGFGLKTGNGSEYFWVGQIKMFSDGALGSRTALVSRPYPDGTYGIEVMSTKSMAEIANIAHAMDMGVAIHTIGDASAANVARVMKMTNGKDTIEHLQCASPELIKEIAVTGVPVIANPSHIPLDATTIHTDWKELVHFAYPIGTLLANGVNVGFGSDAPVATVNPLYAIACATSRRGVSTRTVNPREAITYSAAMEIITEKSAKIIGGPDRGKLERGYLADLAITEDFRGLEPWECVEKKFVATYVGGRLAWERKP